jgi:hypothetical protein
LIGVVYAAAERSGTGQVYWFTHRSNHAARRLYDRLAVNAGFVLYERYGKSALDEDATGTERQGKAT